MRYSAIITLSWTKQVAIICKALEHLGVKVLRVKNIIDIKAGLMSYSPAFLLLDGDMEESKSILAEVLTNNVYPPPYVIMLGEFLDYRDRIALINTGADVCVHKPVEAEEILSIVKSVIRREEKFSRLPTNCASQCIEYKEMIIDPVCRVVKMRGESVALTTKEFDILCLLVRHQGEVLTKEKIYESVWKEECSLSAAYISGHIFSLRKKMGLDPKNRDYIQTVFGVGYRFAKKD